ncbi:AbaSI family restriction endonuclease [Celerinatantimonas sp. MCCC 1A17872]|uniref:AbaSI family restriction endonuclease n=1 Tax=Celerinatantimonas sp. MCCC 1A17872 TaxID=3177514 RepID=UPI0038CB8035
MPLTKTEYILESISKIHNKKWEFFIITRIIHAISDDIEFITQQLVRKADGTRALTDLYFPQFNLHLEIDELHHQRQIREDEQRERDIIQVTDHSIEHIKVSDRDEPSTNKELNDIRNEVDRFIEKIMKLKDSLQSQNKFAPWNFENKYLAKSHIERGYISLKDDVVFKTQIEAMKCFGFKGKGYQKGAWEIPDGTHDCVWFPRLYEHFIWNNNLSQDGMRIYEEASHDKSKIEQAKTSISSQKEEEIELGERKHIVFAKAKDVFGFNLLRYVGTFRMNLDASTDTCIRFDRISDKESIRQF